MKYITIIPAVVCIFGCSSTVDNPNMKYADLQNLINQELPKDAHQWSSGRNSGSALIHYDFDIGLPSGSDAVNASDVADKIIGVVNKFENNWIEGDSENTGTNGKISGRRIKISKDKIYIVEVYMIDRKEIQGPAIRIEYKEIFR